MSFRQRMFEEHSQLQQRVGALERFILSGEFDALDVVERIDLKDQLTHMKAYRDVLSRRVSRQCGNA